MKAHSFHEGFHLRKAGIIPVGYKKRFLKANTPFVASVLLCCVPYMCFFSFVFSADGTVIFDHNALPAPMKERFADPAYQPTDEDRRILIDLLHVTYTATSQWVYTLMRLRCRRAHKPQLTMRMCVRVPILCVFVCVCACVRVSSFHEWKQKPVYPYGRTTLSFLLGFTQK